MAQILCFQNLNPDPDPPNSQVFVQYNLKEYPNFYRVIPIKGWVRINVLGPDPLFLKHGPLDPDPDPPDSQVFVQYNLKEFSQIYTY